MTVSERQNKRKKKQTEIEKREVMDKRKWCMHPSPERYTKEGTANVCVHDRVFQNVQRGIHTYYECVARCTVHLQHPTLTLQIQSDLQIHLTFAGKT